MSEASPSLAARAALVVVRFYQRFLSRMLHAIPGTGCRFHPTCSAYMATALARHGFWKGSRLGVCRIGRCHPWGGSGVDEVPKG